MMDEFEKNIRAHSKEFGSQRPNREKMWANIEGRLPTAEAKRIPLWKNTKLRFAAGFALLFGLASIILMTMGNPANQSLANNMPHELLEINMHYKKLVDYQLVKLEKNAVLSPSEKEEFRTYIKELEKENELLKSELQNNFDNQEVLEAIISNYKKQIEVIERLLYRLNNSEKESKNEDIII